MKKFLNKIYLLSGIFYLAGVLLISGCAEDPVPSIFDIPGGTGQTPVISSINPSDEALAGVTEVTISGEHFSVNPEYNLVFFNGARAAIISAAPTQLVVVAPNLVSDSVVIKIAVVGALHFSNTINYRLLPAISLVTDYFDPAAAKPYGLTVDLQENIYVSVDGGTASLGIKKISSNGDISNFTPAHPAIRFFHSIQLGPSSIIYGVARRAGVFQFQENQTPSTFVSSGIVGNLVDLDFDQNNNIWTGGSGTSIFRVTQDRNIKAFAFGPPVSAVRVFENYLYVGGLDVDSLYKVWRLPIISSDSLGQRELYFNLGEVNPNIRITGITFALDGDLYIGTDRIVSGTGSYINSIIVVHPDKSNSILYPGIITTPVFSFAWGAGNFLYYTHEAQTIYKINMEKPGAPYYGRN
jgi:hypothetical protein